MAPALADFCNMVVRRATPLLATPPPQRVVCGGVVCLRGEPLAQSALLALGAVVQPSLLRLHGIRCGGGAPLRSRLSTIFVLSPPLSTLWLHGQANGMGNVMLPAGVQAYPGALGGASVGAVTPWSAHCMRMGGATIDDLDPQRWRSTLVDRSTPEWNRSTASDGASEIWIDLDDAVEEQAKSRLGCPPMPTGLKGSGLDSAGTHAGGRSTAVVIGKRWFARSTRGATCGSANAT
mmetsp:Transcript_81947/g.228396  ORF Transcript_81947/g.228396 Transcript_81947/m.228396 type:complete len:235 (+) Transcript_81947:1392-2096(+)